MIYDKIVTADCLLDIFSSCIFLVNFYSSPFTCACWVCFVTDTLNTNYFGTTFDGVSGSFHSNQVECMCSQNIISYTSLFIFHHFYLSLYMLLIHAIGKIMFSVNVCVCQCRYYSMYFCERKVRMSLASQTQAQSSKEESLSD